MTDEQTEYNRLVDEARRLLSLGADWERVLVDLRGQGATPIQSIKVLRDVRGLSLRDAKVAFHEAGRGLTRGRRSMTFIPRLK